MPRFPAGATRGDWQIVSRVNEAGEKRWWLQRQTSAGLWTDYSGPYKQRGAALARYRRMEFYYLMDVRRDPAHVHTFPAPGTVVPAWARYCAECGVYVEPEAANSLYDSSDLDAHLADEFGEDRTTEARWLRETEETRREANWRPGQE